MMTDVTWKGYNTDQREVDLPCCGTYTSRTEAIHAVFQPAIGWMEIFACMTGIRLRVTKVNYAAKCNQAYEKSILDDVMWGFLERHRGL